MKKRLISLITLVMICLAIQGLTAYAENYRQNRLHAIPAVPKLIATYNGAKGIGIKWQACEGAVYYVIYRKYNGKWSRLAEIAANDPLLQKSGNTLMYTDQTVRTQYGKGFIYSAAAGNSSGTSKYNTAGLPAYRLVPPAIKSVKVTGDGEVTVTWNKVACQGYEVQYTTAGNTSNWKKARQVAATSQKISGLKKNTKYVFRIRCQKTNKDRGTTWSEYSPWYSLKVTEYKDPEAETKIDLKIYVGKSMTEIKKNFPGGTYPQRNVAERAFYDLGWVEFAYGVPVANPKAGHVILKQKKAGYSLMGLTVGENEKTALAKIKADGWKEDSGRSTTKGSNHLYYLWKNGTSRIMLIRTSGQIIREITYGETEF